MKFKGLIHPMEEDWRSFDERMGFTDGIWDLHVDNEYITVTKYNLILGEDLP